ncbi:MAG: TetR/AcrR family transcriptional regulator [Candidatus Rokuibacteriota bacterium]
MAKPRARRPRDPKGTREAILEAALRRLAADGPEGISLSQVAHLAGVNRGTAYQHFETREKLIQATTQWASDKLFRAVFGDPTTPGGRRVVPALTDRLTNFAMENSELCRLWLLQVLSSPDPASDPFWKEWEDSMARFAKTELAQENLDTEVASVIMLAGAFLWPVWARAHARDRRELPLLAHRFAQELLRLCMYGTLKPEHYPEIASRLKGGHASRPARRGQLGRKSTETLRERGSFVKAH